MATNGNSFNSGRNDWGSWLPILILFCIPTPLTWIIALYLLVQKLRGLSASQKALYRRQARDAANRVRREANHLFGQQNGQNQTWQSRQGQPNGQDGPTGPGAEGQNGQDRQTQNFDWQQAQAQARPQQAQENTRPQGSGGNLGGRPGKGKKLGKAPGVGLIIGGGIASGCFALGFVSEVIEFLEYGFSDDLIGVLSCALFLAGAVAMLFSGVTMNRRQERYANYLAYIGTNREIGLARMAANFDIPVKKLCRDLRKMLSKGILPTGYIDLAEGKLYLTEMGYCPPEREQKAPEPEEERQDAEEEKGDAAILREIRQVNDEIPDEAMSAKIDRIEEITRKILKFQTKHPDRAGELRPFLNYYLPTTLKILRAYAQLDAQGIEGENISAAKGRIEGMMDQVVAGFEKQLDKLFQNEALDIASDVQVLENMLKKDGLSSGGGITLGL